MAETRRTDEEHSIHGHLHANVAMPNSCYMDDIYCCNSFTVAVTVFFANPDSKGKRNKKRHTVMMGLHYESLS